ncbi:hypothetical protein MTsPCn5_39040 [Croceitalea sp. MTPC5]|nr:hypothetical protein MTsPCn5_39040 [Croceitalea sp. MTPC5]
MDYTIYIILGALALVYFIVLFNNKRNNRRRKSRSFMEGKRKHENK